MKSIRLGDTATPNFNIKTSNFSKIKDYKWGLIFYYPTNYTLAYTTKLDSVKKYRNKLQ